jgi:hypothetical protein
MSQILTAPMPRAAGQGLRGRRISKKRYEIARLIDALAPRTKHRISSNWYLENGPVLVQAAVERDWARTDLDGDAHGIRDIDVFALNIHLIVSVLALTAILLLAWLLPQPGKLPGPLAGSCAEGRLCTGE